MYSVHMMFVLLMFFEVYAIVAKTVRIRRFGSYVALPTLGSASIEPNNIDMKSLALDQRLENLLPS